MNVNEMTSDNYPPTFFFLKKTLLVPDGKALPPAVLLSHFEARIFKTLLFPKITFHASSLYSAVQTSNSIPIL